MNNPTNESGNGGRRKFITIVAGVASALFLGERAMAAKKPVAKKSTKKSSKKPPKKPVKKAPAKPVAKSTPTPSSSPTPSASPTPTAAPSPSASVSASPAPTTSSSPAVATPPADAKALTVAGRNLTTAELAIGATTAATFSKNGRATAVLVTRIDERKFVALRPVCTHAGGPVELSGGSLVCVWHNSRFNQRTGEVTSGPADSPLPQENVSLIGDVVYYVP